MPTLEQLERRAKEIFFEEAEKQGVVYELYPSDPANFILKAMAVYAFYFYQQLQESGEEAFLPFAKGENLNYFAKLFQEEREQIGTNPDGSPIYNIPDDEFQALIQIAFDKRSPGGTENRYIGLAREAPGGDKLADVAAYSPEEKLAAKTGLVRVVLLFKDEVMTAVENRTGLVEGIRAYLMAKERKPVTDRLTVEEARGQGGFQEAQFKIEAELKIPAGVTPTVVMQDARASLQNYLQRNRGIGKSITRNGLIAALFAGNNGRFNVEDVNLIFPEADVICEPFEYPKLAKRETQDKKLEDDITLREWKEKPV